MASPLVPELLALDAAEPAPDRRRPGAHDHCLNCGAPLTGPYCAQCGQFDAPSDPTLREIFSDAWDALTSLDGKLAASLRSLLSRPGALTRETLAGRRARYLPPFRLYLICSIAFFLVSAWEEKRNPDGVRGGIVWRETADSAAVARKAARDSARDARRDSIRAVQDADSAARVVAADGWWERRKGAIGQRMRTPEMRQRIGEEFSANLPKLMFFLVPVYALLLRLAYRNRRWHLPAHLVAALHMHAFFFVVLLAGDLDSLLFGESLAPWSDLAILAWLGWYGVAMLRGAYGGRWRTTIARAAFVSSIYGITVVCGMLGLFLTLVLLG